MDFRLTTAQTDKHPCCLGAKLSGGNRCFCEFGFRCIWCLVSLTKVKLVSPSLTEICTENWNPKNTTVFLKVKWWHFEHKLLQFIQKSCALGKPICRYGSFIWPALGRQTVKMKLKNHRFIDRKSGLNQHPCCWSTHPIVTTGGQHCHPYHQHQHQSWQWWYGWWSILSGSVNLHFQPILTMLITIRVNFNINI